MNERNFLKLMRSKKYGINERLYWAITRLLEEDQQHDIVQYKTSFLRKY